MTSKSPVSRSLMVGNNPSGIVAIWKEIVPKLEARNFSRDDIFAVRLALNEAFLNALSHGNRMNPRKQVKIDYSVKSDRVELSVSDQGAGFDPDDVPDPRCGENLYKSVGRGLLLMRSYMDVVEFNNRGNAVHMVKYRLRPQPAKTRQQKQA